MRFWNDKILQNDGKGEFGKIVLKVVFEGNNEVILG